MKIRNNYIPYQYSVFPYFGINHCIINLPTDLPVYQYKVLAKYLYDNDLATVYDDGRCENTINYSQLCNDKKFIEVYQQAENKNNEK